MCYFQANISKNFLGRGTAPPLHRTHCIAHQASSMYSLCDQENLMKLAWSCKQAILNMLQMQTLIKLARFFTQLSWLDSPAPWDSLLSAQSMWYVLDLPLHTPRHPRRRHRWPSSWARTSSSTPVRSGSPRPACGCWTLAWHARAAAEPSTRPTSAVSRHHRPQASQPHPQSHLCHTNIQVTMGWLKMTDMKLTDQVSRHEIDGHEIDGPSVQAWKWRTRYISFENRLYYNAVCNSFQNNGRIQVTAAPAPTYSACVFLLTWARMKDTVIVAMSRIFFVYSLIWNILGIGEVNG